MTDANGEEVPDSNNPQPQPQNKLLEEKNHITLALKGTYLDKTQFSTYASAIQAAYLEVNAGR